MYYFDKCCWLIITFQSQKLVQKLTLEKSIYFKYLILDDNSMPLPIKNLMANWQTRSSRNVCTFCKFQGRASLRLVEFLAFWHLACLVSNNAMITAFFICQQEWLRMVFFLSKRKRDSSCQGTEFVYTNNLQE